MKKLLLISAMLVLWAGSSLGQINYFTSFDGCDAASCSGWTISGGYLPRITSTVSLGYTPCNTASAKSNIYLGNATTTLVTTSSLGTSTGEPAILSFNGKAINYNAGTATPANSCTFTASWGNSGAGPWTTISSVNNISSTACNTYTFSAFTPTLGQPVFIRIVATRIAGDFWAVIDDISLSQAAAGLPNPSNFTATAISHNQINLSWNLNANGDPVMIAFNTVNTFGTPSGSYNVGDPIAGGGTVIYMGTGTSFQHTGLDANKDYFYRAWSYNISNEYSSSTSASAKTLCELVTVPFVQDFEAATFPPECWSLVAGSGNWNRQTGVSGYGIGNASAMANFYNINGTIPFDLITIGFDLPLASLSFDHAYRTYITAVDSLFILYSTDNGLTYTILVKLDGGVSGPLVTAPPSTTPFNAPTADQWATKSYLLPAGTNKLKFQAKSAYGNNLYLDNIKIDEIPVAPTFSITPESWNFGNIIAQGPPATKIFTIKNEGFETLIITDISLVPEIAAPNEFTLVNPPATIELGTYESATLTVAFTPNSPGMRSATLNLTSNSRAQHSVQLTGAGVDVTGAVLFAQDPKYLGEAINSTFNPPTYFEAADNFWGIEGEIARFAFYGLFLTTPAPSEPFFIRFYEYSEGYVPALAAQETGTYKLALKDSYGDGWAGDYPVSGTKFHKVTLLVNGVPVLIDITMLNGYGPVYHPFDVNAGDEISTVFAINGSFASECYYAILDPNDNIVAEQGGTWANPGASTPGNINPGSIQPLEPDWNNPVSAQIVYVTPLPVGTTFAGYPVYKLVGDLHVPVDMAEGWFSAQFDGVTGTPTIFYWLPGLDGDGLSHQRTTALRQTFARGENDPSFLPSKEGEGYYRAQRNDDRAFELLGHSILIPISNWALYISVFLIAVFIFIRFRRMV